MLASKRSVWYPHPTSLALQLISRSNIPVKSLLVQLSVLVQAGLGEVGQYVRLIEIVAVA